MVRGKEELCFLPFGKELLHILWNRKVADPEQVDGDVRDRRAGCCRELSGAEALDPEGDQKSALIPTSVMALSAGFANLNTGLAIGSGFVSVHLAAVCFLLGLLGIACAAAVAVRFCCKMKEAE